MNNWACNCPLCRVLVHPILRLLAPNREKGHVQKPPEQKQQAITKESEEKEETSSVKRSEETSSSEENLSKGSEAGEREQRKEEKKEAQEESVESKQQIEGVVQQSERGLQGQTIQSIVEPIQPQQQPGQGEIKLVIPEEVREKIERLEEELEKLRSELKEALENISEALIDVRAAVVENINPFLMANGDRQTADMPSPSVDAGHIVELVRALNEELDKFNPNTLVELIDGLAESGSIGESTARILKALVKAVSEMKKKGVSVDEQIRLITLLLSRRVKSKRVG